ncbi:MAG: AAA family ATPase [Alphaproteobacteria bacterium]|nr:AAA family ATPase [Alphaproteobacteria bacterium]
MSTQPSPPKRGMRYSPILASHAQFADMLRAYGGYENIDPVLMATGHITMMQIEENEKNPFKGNIQGMILDGDPGTGKSFFAKAIANAFDGRFLVHLGNPDADHTELVRGINPVEVAKAMAGQTLTTTDESGNAVQVTIREEHIYTLGKLLEAFLSSHEKFTVLLFDEAEKNRFSVQTALLTILQDGEIPLSGKIMDEDGEAVTSNGPFSQIVHARRDNLLILAAKNKERDLYDATMRRFRVVYAGYPSPQKELEILSKQHGAPQEVTAADEARFKALLKTPEAFMGNVQVRHLETRVKQELKRIVRAASGLRGDPGITKKPSYPEVSRMVQDFMLVAKYLVHVEQSRSSPDKKIYRSELFRKVLTQLYVNGLVQRQEEQSRAAKTLGDVRGAGPGFLKAILRAIEGEDYTLTYGE